MATGEILFRLFAPEGDSVASAAAIPNTRNAHPILEYADDATLKAIWTRQLPANYAGGGFDVTPHWTSVATTGNVIWMVSVERMVVASLDIDADSFATAVTSSASGAEATSGHIQDSLTIAMTDGAQIDSVAVGEMCRIKFERDHDHASDTLSGNTELLFLEITET